MENGDKEKEGGSSLLSKRTGCTVVGAFRIIKAGQLVNY